MWSFYKRLFYKLYNININIIKSYLNMPKKTLFHYEDGNRKLTAGDIHMETYENTNYMYFTNKLLYI
jgi:hypothetical protein